eukprot:COSAG02_NODE_7179_length_3135_cov_20.129117_2_plen_50_part_00
MSCHVMPAMVSFVEHGVLARAEPFRGSFFAGLNAAAQFGGSQAVDFCNN